MKQFFIILALCLAFPSVSFTASIEQERMQQSIEQEKEEQKQQEQQALQPEYCLIVPTGYIGYPVGGKYHPENRPRPKPCPGGKPNPKPCPINK